MTYPRAVTGRQYPIAFPTTIEAMLDGGPALLTALFHATGVLPGDDRVTAITGHKEFFGGGMGRKLCLSVTYDCGEGLSTELFAKFPRDFGDALRPLFSPLMESEVSFAALSMQPDFAIAVPRCYFGDYDPDSLSGLLITDRILYGQDGIEPCHDKCLDYRIPDLLGHYEAMTRSMARLAAAHKSGALGAAVDARFPFDPDAVDVGAQIPYTPQQLEEKIAKLRQFAADVPQLIPEDLREPAFLDRFAREARLVYAEQGRIRAHLNRASDYVALCHWNVNVDNAWFWRGEDGTLEVGLLDWGSVGQMNIAQSFFGMTCAAETDFLNAHRGDLLHLLASEYRAAGGPAIEVAALETMYRLSVALLSIAWLIDAPSIIEANLPDVATVTGRRDPKLIDCFLARAQQHIMTVMLNEWRYSDMEATIASIADIPAAA